MVEPLGFGESLGLGDEREQVGTLQRWLRHLGYYLGEVDERFGDTTEQAVREYQRLSGGVEDGRVTVETWEALDTAACSAGYGADTQQEAEPGSLSEDGQWRWDGSAWTAVGEQEPAAESQLSEDGQWWWDGSAWKAVDEHQHEHQPGAETPVVDVSNYPRLRPGETGDWVDYLDSMLASKGY